MLHYILSSEAYFVIVVHKIRFKVTVLLDSHKPATNTKHLSTGAAVLAVPT